MVAAEEAERCGLVSRVCPAASFGLQDHHEGMTAFLEKRSPQFNSHVQRRTVRKELNVSRAR
jgi:enoyl-CoA hydratase/carnithine racemase